MLEQLIDLFPHVRFLQEHHAHVRRTLEQNQGALVFTAEMALPLSRRGVKLYPDRPKRPPRS